MTAPRRELLVGDFPFFSHLGLKRQFFIYFPPSVIRMSQQGASDHQPVVSLLSLMYDLKQVKQFSVTVLQTGGTIFQEMLEMPQHSVLQKEAQHESLVLDFTRFNTCLLCCCVTV